MSQLVDFRIGLDLGGTKIEAIVIDQKDNSIFKERVLTEASKGYATILTNINNLLQKAIQTIPSKSGYTIGMGIPGIINPKTGLVVNSNTTILIDKPLKQDLQELAKHPIEIQNDANCFALAEAVAGAVREYEFIFGIIMGTGCGGGLCIHKKVRYGLHGIAGEWGHASIDPQGELCYSGFYGCIESKISGKGVETSHNKRTGESLTMPEIIEAWRDGDPKSSQTMEIFFKDFGRAVAVLINILDPDAIVIGGGLSNIPELYTIGYEQVKLNTFYNNPKTPVLKNQLGDSAGVIGAAWIGSQDNQYFQK